MSDSITELDKAIRAKAKDRAIQKLRSLFEAFDSALQDEDLPTGSATAGVARHRVIRWCGLYCTQSTEERRAQKEEIENWLADAYTKRLSAELLAEADRRFMRGGE